VIFYRNCKKQKAIAKTASYGFHCSAVQIAGL